MTENRPVLGLVGSPNKSGRTDELVSASLAGAQRAGAATELVQMSEHVVEACKDCLPWVCDTNLKCTYKDEGFEFLAEKVSQCGALVLGTPVYWGDTSAMVRYLFIKLARIYARSASLKGLPALGIAIAGGTGNGMATGLRPVYHFFRALQMRALDPIPATRFDFDSAKEKANRLGYDIGQMTSSRAPFESSEECWLWYDRLPYIGERRAEERKLLASVAVEAVPNDKKRELQGSLEWAEILAASGKPLEALKEITKVYDSAIKAIG